jgi:hypothetical protein
MVSSECLNFKCLAASNTPTEFQIAGQVQGALFKNFAKVFCFSAKRPDLTAKPDVCSGEIPLQGGGYWRTFHWSSDAIFQVVLNSFNNPGYRE